MDTYRTSYALAAKQNEVIRDLRRVLKRGGIGSTRSKKGRAAVLRGAVIKLDGAFDRAVKRGMFKGLNG